MRTETFSASGKLLLFGEFLVLRGSMSLALPLRFGQSLKVRPQTERGIIWESFDMRGNCWLRIRFSKDLDITHADDIEQAEIARQLLLLIRERRPKFLLDRLRFRFDLGFDRNFGFGTSSTLISLLSQWSGIDPYDISDQSFHTSGYDIAAASVNRPFIYSMRNRIIDFCEIDKQITSKLLFVYLGEKQSTAKRVSTFNEQKGIPESKIAQMDNIVIKAVDCKDILRWENLMEESEQLIAPLLRMLPVKKKYFEDYPFAVKSLGAWGGDFVMATCRDIRESKKYFTEKEKTPVYTYEELVNTHE